MKSRYLVVLLWLVGALASPLGAIAAVNLRVDSISVPAGAVAAGGNVQFTATVTNIGDEVTVAIVKVYLSSDAELTTADDQMLWFAQSPLLSPGQSATVVQSVPIPARMATGDYFLGTIVEGFSADVSPADNVAVLGISVVGGSCTPDAFETDDTRANARPVGIDELQMRNHCDDPDDWMSFQAIAGTRYGIQASPAGYQSDMLTIALFGADGALVAQTVNGSSDFPKLIWTAPETAVYYVRVRPYFQWTRVGPNTEYSFVIADTLADLVVPFSDTQSKVGTAGGTDWFYTNVANYGMVDSGPLEVGVHISASPNVTRADRRIGSRRIANLPADRSMNIANVQIAFPGDLPAGTYYIAPIVDDGNAVAEYEENNNVGQPAQVLIAGPSCAPDAFEDNDLPEMARPVVVGAQIPNNFCEDGFDWFSFEAQAGRTYFLRAIYPAPYPGAPSQLAGPVEVYDLNGQLLAQGNGVVGWTPMQAGTYRALVRGGSLSANTYYFGVLDQLPDLVAVPYSSMDTGGVPRGGVIDDGTWAVRNDGFTDAPLSSLGLYFSADDVITRTDTLLQSVPVPVLAPGAQASQIFVRVPVPRTQAPGMYYFGALADVDNAMTEVDETNNSYAIRDIQVYDAACAADAYDDDDVPGQAKPLGIGETQSRNFCDDGWDWMTVDLQAGTTYAFDMKGIITGSRGRVLVYDTDAKTVLVDNQGMFAALTAPATGRYYVLATTLDQYGYRTVIGTNTNYTLKASACQPDAFENDDADRTAGKPIAVGASQARNHCEDGVDWAALTLSAPGNYVIATSALGPAADTALEIHSATSTTPLASNDNASVNNKASSVTYNFAAAGTYYIKVIGWQRGAGTEYTLSVQPAKGKK
jgi:hypothetical protein